METEVKGRVEYIDIFRGLGILLMVMGHIGFGSCFDYYIHAFNMPMFFFASGWFFREKESIAVFMKKKSKSLLLPYFSFLCLAIFIWAIFEFNLEEIASIINHALLVNTEGIPIAQALWFLTSLFCCEFIYRLLCCLIDDYRKRTFLVLFIAVLGCLSYDLFGLTLPWGLSASLAGLFFFHAAYCIKYNNKLKKLVNINPAGIFVLGVISFVLIFSNDYVNMRTSNYGNIILFWAASFSSIIFVWNLCRTISSIGGVFTLQTDFL